MAARITSWVLGVVLGGLYLAALVTPIGNLIYLPQGALTISLVGWVLLIANVVLPPLALVLALFMGRGHTAARRLLLLLAGLALVALLQFEQIFVVPMSLYFVV